MKTDPTSTRQTELKQDEKQGWNNNKTSRHRKRSQMLPQTLNWSLCAWFFSVKVMPLFELGVMLVRALTVELWVIAFNPSKLPPVICPGFDLDSIATMNINLSSRLARPKSPQWFDLQNRNEFTTYQMFKQPSKRGFWSMVIWGFVENVCSDGVVSAMGRVKVYGGFAWWRARRWERRRGFEARLNGWWSSGGVLKMTMVVVRLHGDLG